MGILDDVRRLFGGKPITGGARAGHREVGNVPPGPLETDSGETHWSSSATEPPSFAAPETPAVQVLTQGPLTDLKRVSKYLASIGVSSHLLRPPGGCGT